MAARLSKVMSARLALDTVLVLGLSREYPKVKGSSKVRLMSASVTPSPLCTVRKEREHLAASNILIKHRIGWSLMDQG